MQACKFLPTRFAVRNYPYLLIVEKPGEITKTLKGNYYNAGL
jgi:hypothetical protein